MDEREDNCEDLILLASAIGIELCRGKSIREMKRIRTVINQISCSISSIISEKSEKFDKK